MKKQKNQQYTPASPEGFSDGRGNKTSLIGKVTNAGKRALQRGFSLIEVVIVLTLLVVVSAVIYTTVGGSSDTDPIRAKSLLQNAKTIAAAVRRTSKYLNSTPMNVKALINEGEFFAKTTDAVAYNNSKGLASANESLIGNWSGPYVEGIDVVEHNSIDSSIGSGIGSGAPSASKIQSINLDDIVNGKKGFLYVGDKYSFYFIGPFNGLDDSLLEQYIALCNHEDAGTITATDTTKTIADIPDKGKCFVPDETKAPASDFAPMSGSSKLVYVAGTVIQGTENSRYAGYVIEETKK